MKRKIQCVRTSLEAVVSTWIHKTTTANQLDAHFEAVFFSLKCKTFFFFPWRNDLNQSIVYFVEIVFNSQKSIQNVRSLKTLVSLQIRTSTATNEHDPRFEPVRSPSSNESRLPQPLPVRFRKQEYFESFYVLKLYGSEDVHSKTNYKTIGSGINFHKWRLLWYTLFHSCLILWRDNMV